MIEKENNIVRTGSEHCVLASSRSNVYTIHTIVQRTPACVAFWGVAKLLTGR